MAKIENSGTTKNSPTPSRRTHPDDIVLWPDGFWACLREVWNNEFDHRSDDYEIIGHDDIKRLMEVGILDQIM